MKQAYQDQIESAHTPNDVMRVVNRFLTVYRIPVYGSGEASINSLRLLAASIGTVGCRPHVAELLRCAAERLDEIRH